ncbi:MAG TPA: hypothetical protein VIM75_24570 [Ohtaekwangia sp.]|uniref:hypothetical protein n=1 Tax=Ohtaekwangia sp. TaxID=2066019 RepID=UPI002F94F1BB
MLGTSHRHAPKNSMSLTFLKSVRDWVIVGEENQQWHGHDALNGRSPVDMLTVDLWKIPEEFPTNPQRAITTTINEIF